MSPTKKHRISKPGRRIAGRGDRILMAIKFARQHIKDDDVFVREVNAILVREKILAKAEFGSLETPDLNNGDF